MERINVNDFNYKERKGEILHCIELVTNDDEERSLDLFEVKTEKEAIEKAEELNKSNQDKRSKYIAINYLVEEDGLSVC